MPRSKAEQRLASIRLKGVPGQSAPPPLGKVTAADIESFLSECDRDVLNKALKKLRKEVYKGQLSLHRAASNPRNKSAGKKILSFCRQTMCIYARNLDTLL